MADSTLLRHPIRWIDVPQAFKEFGLFFALQFVSYLNITIDYRAVASEQYVAVAVCNMVAPIIAWVMVRRIGTATNEIAGMVAVALGGALASLLGIWLTRSWQ